MSPSRGRWFRVGLFVLWNATIFWFSSQPSLPDAGFSFPGMDKVEHGLAYAVGAGLLCLAWPPRAPLGVLGLMAVMLAVGVSDEFHQTFTPGRSGNDPGDLAADMVGSAIGILLVLALMRRASPQLPSRG